MQKGTSDYSLSALDVNTDGLVDTQDVLTIYEIMQKAATKHRSIRAAKQQCLKELILHTQQTTQLSGKAAKAKSIIIAMLPK